MKVLVFEQFSGGHYTNYLNCLVPALAGLGDSLAIAVNARMRASPSAAAGWATIPNVSFASTVPDVSPHLALRDRKQATQHLIDAIDEARPDFVVLPSADAPTTGLAMLAASGARRTRGLPRIEGTFHFGYGHAAVSNKQRVKEFVYSQTYRNAPYASLNFVSFAYYEFLREKRLVEPSRLRLVGDPVPQPPRVGRHAARRALGLDPDGRYLGIVGTLDERKAIPELLRAFRAARLRADDRLFLAGRLAPNYIALIKNEYRDLIVEGRLVVHDRFLRDAELQLGYEALDVATMGYYGFPGLASLALKAIAARTPIIGHDFGWLRALIRRFDVGHCTDIFDVACYAATIEHALEQRRTPLGGEAVERLLRFHDPDNFVARMTSGVREAAGRPAAPSLDWPWVLAALPEERRALL